jgi:hypothetical protein
MVVAFDNCYRTWEGVVNVRHWDRRHRSQLLDNPDDNYLTGVPFDRCESEFELLYIHWAARLLDRDGPASSLA